MKLSTLLRAASEGRLELMSDARVGYHVEVRMASGKRKWVMVERG